MANKILAICLSIIAGLGNIYLGLTKRGIVELIVMIILSTLSAYIGSIGSLIALIWFIYCLFDTSQCADAVNNHTKIPLFLTKFELE